MKTSLIIIAQALVAASIVQAEMATSAAPVERGAIRKAIIAKFDSNADGALSSEEKAAAKASIIAKYDRDGDGTLRSERRAFRKKLLLVRFDKDGDGKLDASERQAAKNARNQ